MLRASTAAPLSPAAAAAGALTRGVDPDVCAALLPLPLRERLDDAARPAARLGATGAVDSVAELDVETDGAFKPPSSGFAVRGVSSTGACRQRPRPDACSGCGTSLGATC